MLELFLKVVMEASFAVIAAVGVDWVNRHHHVNDSSKKSPSDKEDES